MGSRRSREFIQRPYLMAVTAVAYYLTAYFVTTLGAFGIVTLLSGRDMEADPIEDYQGLAWQRPWVAAVLPRRFCRWRESF